MYVSFRKGCKRVPVLNVRNFPQELRIKLKVQAAKREVSLRELVIEYCREGLKREKTKRPRPADAHRTGEKKPGRVTSEDMDGLGPLDPAFRMDL
jgi:plasmid stability protein